MEEPLTLPETAPRVIYPPPPNVHWGVLLAAEFVIALLVIWIFPKLYWNFVSNLAVDAWAIYLCLWLHKLDVRFMSIFWCAAYVASQLALTAPSGPQPSSDGIPVVASILALVSLGTWIVTIFVIRAELHIHYNVREPVGLYLSGAMTFLFSFLYFQYHLYKIAQLREKYGDRPFYYQGGPPPTLPDS
jgi:hypothetical protein